MLKLNVGCGEVILPGWVNIDKYWPKADLKADALALPFADNSVDELLSCHVLEHFHFHDGFRALKEWYRVLKPGGLMIIELPNFLEACRKFVNGSEQDRLFLYPQIFGQPWHPGHTHLFGYTKTQLLWSLACIGFKNPIEERALRFTNLENVCMRFRCRK